MSSAAAAAPFVAAGIELAPTTVTACQTFVTALVLLGDELEETHKNTAGDALFASHLPLHVLLVTRNKETQRLVRQHLDLACGVNPN